MKTDLVKDFGFPNMAPVFLFVKKGLDFGICMIDKRECYAKGGICRFNPLYFTKGLRNKNCSNFRKVEK